jgi:hypothetical protein
MKVIVVNGYPRSGKDTFCKFGEEKYDCVNYSTVDTVKLLATIMGWDGTKTPENRAMLSALKDFTTEWFDMTYVEMTDLIKNAVMYEESNNDHVDFIFLHIREKKEIERIRDWCVENDVDCKLVCIEKDSVVEEQSNHADANIHHIKYDTYLKNYGTLEEFKDITLNYLDSLVKTGD